PGLDRRDRGTGRIPGRAVAELAGRRPHESTDGGEGPDRPPVHLLRPRGTGRHHHLLHHRLGGDRPDHHRAVGPVHDPRLPLQGDRPVRDDPGDRDGDPVAQTHGSDVPGAAGDAGAERRALSAPCVGSVASDGPRRGGRRHRQDGAMSTTPHPSAPPVDADTDPAPVPSVADSRPFGAHLRMSWWRPLIIIVVPLVFMFVAQLALTLVVAIVEMAAFGRDPMSLEMTPLMMLAANLSLALMGPLAVLLTAWLGKVPWRRVLASPRALSGRRFAGYLAGFGVLVLAAMAVMTLAA